MPKFSVGQRVWEFNENHRVYRRNACGQAYGGPIYEKHFSPNEVVAVEEKGYRIRQVDSKFTPDLITTRKAEKSYFTDQEKEDMIWVNDYRHRIWTAVQECRDANVLRNVAEIIGFVPDVE